MSDAVLTALLFFGLLFAILIGFPVAFSMGGLAAIFLFWQLGEGGLTAVVLKAFTGATTFVLVACPLFIFMGLILERSGIAEALYEAMYKWLGWMKGGLAIGTIIICAIFAACTGITGAATVTMSYVALPSMLKRGYNKHLAIGTVAGGGLLGILIPPSLDFIILGLFGNTSIGGLFAAGLVTGLVLTGVYIIYIMIVSYVNKDVAPAVPKEERANMKEKLVSLKGLILPVALVLLVLGAIFSGAATPTEGAAIGAAGSLICAAINRRLNWTVFKEATIRAFRVSVMLMWMTFASYSFVSATSVAGTGPLVTNWMLNMPGGAWGAVIAIFMLFFLMGFVMPIGGIIMVTAPIFFPLMDTLGFSRLWFGVLMVMNTELSFITPPFGFNLFYMKAVTPEIDPSITTGDIYKAVFPFVGCILVAVVLVAIFPQTATWLPRVLMGIE